MVTLYMNGRSRTYEMITCNQFTMMNQALRQSGGLDYWPILSIQLWVAIDTKFSVTRNLIPGTSTETLC